MGAPEHTPDGDKFDVLAILVEAYEKTRWPVAGTSPLDILTYAITDMGRSQKELAEILGSRSLASEILRGKQRISLAVAHTSSAAWNIPLGLSTAPYPEGKAA